MMENNIALFSNSPSAVLLARIDGTILEVNKTAAIMFGYDKEEFITLSIKNIIDVIDIPSFLEELAVKDTTRDELTAIRNNGEKFPIQFSSAVFQDRSEYIII